MVLLFPFKEIGSRNLICLLVVLMNRIKCLLSKHLEKCKLSDLQNCSLKRDLQGQSWLCPYVGITPSFNIFGRWSSQSYVNFTL